MLPILNQMYFLIKIWKKLYKISCDLHTIKTKVTFRSKNYYPEFLSESTSSVVHPQIQPSTFSQALTLQRILLPIDICQSYSNLHTHTFIHHSSFSSINAPVQSFFHQSHLYTKIYIEIPTSYILCPKKGSKNNAKSFKI